MSRGTTSASALLDLLAAHGELSSVELGEAKQNASTALAWIVVAVVGGLTAWGALNVAVVLALPQAPWKSLCGVAALNLSAALVAGFKARGMLRRPLFELTRRELARDARSILEIVS